MKISSLYIYKQRNKQDKLNNLKLYYYEKEF